MTINFNVKDKNALWNLNPFIEGTQVECMLCLQSFFFNKGTYVVVEGLFEVESQKQNVDLISGWTT